jgi:RHS repeat-associated protein
MSPSEGTDATTGGSVISLPSGGGAISGMGETFSPDLFTGTGNYSVPIALPPGRNGVQPQLGLSYSTGNGNGPYGLGWALSLPGVARKTSRGVPRYRDGGGEPADTFVLSGAEDLVPLPGTGPDRIRYRPRTEGTFARIEHVRDATGDYWEVRGRDGMLTRYGTPRPPKAEAGWRDPAVVSAPAASGPGNRTFAWRITKTVDAFGNLVRFTYVRDRGDARGHAWDQPLLSRIEYADYGDRADPSFLVAVDFAYVPRPDPFSDYRAGFEIRSSLRCTTIGVATHAADGVRRAVREYRLGYEQAPFNGVSLLARVDVVGIDDQATGATPGQVPPLALHGQAPFDAESLLARADAGLEDEVPPATVERLAPLTFGYAAFDPTRRRYRALTGPGLPTVALGDRGVALVDLRGNGLPDIVQLGANPRYWANRGNGEFDLPRSMAEAPPHTLEDPDVRFIDADGDGRADLLVAAGAHAGYYPTTFSGGWSRRSFQSYRQLPTVPPGDPRVRLIDLDGDGLTDVLHSGTHLHSWFNDPDPRLAWQRTAQTDGPGPTLDLADPRVRLADMTGDGLQDLVLLRNGNIAYAPNLGHGRFGAMVQMRNAPRLPDGFDPRRVLLGDVDGDGLADLVYVDRGRVLLWGNQTGNAWTAEPVTITGTPDLVDADSVQLSDLYANGMAGLLYSRANGAAGRVGLRFLDFTGERKPYLLDSMDNHMGAQTTVSYLPSTHFFLRDEADPATRWRTTLPMAVHVVARVEVADRISSGRLTTEYRYHHGYWDGVEREFRGFAMVEHQDTETFHDAAGPDGPGAVHHSPPTRTKSWFHVGPVAAIEAGDWTELDLGDEYWPGDPQRLTRPAEMTAFLARLTRPARRDALRALRGQMLRSELYALDGGAREDRPYTVTESLSGVREESPPAGGSPDRRRIFFAFGVAQRTTQWERGTDPMTRFTFTAGHDRYGFATGELAIAVPRGRDPFQSRPVAGEPYLATYAVTEYARRDDEQRYIVDRVARTTSYEVRNDGRPTALSLRDDVLAGLPAGRASLRVIGHTRAFYDGEAYVGLAPGQIGEHGVAVRSESLAFTDAFLGELFDPADPLAVSPRPAYLKPGEATAWTPEYPDEFRALTPELAGYAHYRDTDVPGSPGGYYVVAERHRYDIHDAGRVPRGLPTGARDALGAESRISYDEHDLLPAVATDPAGLVTRAVHDLRTLQAREVTDVNGNTTAATFSPAGFVTELYVRGTRGEGDAAAPSVRMDYDLLAFAARGQPASVRTTRRIHHDTDAGVPAGERDDVIVSVQYSDGFGRTLQTRSQAEDTLFGDRAFGGGVISVDQTQPVQATVGRTRRPQEPDNVVVSGWQTYDNKGRVVEKYEPFFAIGYDFLAPVEAQLGQKARIFFDPRGQAVRTLNPDGSEQLVVLGVPVDLANPDVYEPSTWETYTYDANDNAGRTHPSAAGAYRAHWNTPASTLVDALGRTVVAVARNGSEPATDWYTTRSTYDIQGNLTDIIDAMGRRAFGYRFDLSNRRWRMDSIDAGRRDSVLDALGNAIEGHDSKGALTLGAFDLLHRPIRLWARDDTTGRTTCRQRIEYGDGGGPAQPASDRLAAATHNLLGRPVHHHDEAGVVTVADIDFKGNVLDTARRVIADKPILAVFGNATTRGWQVTAFQVDWQPGPQQTLAQREQELLEPTGYQTTTSYDALSRAAHLRLPQDVQGQRRQLHPTYNRAGALEQIRLDDTVYVERIAYDAKGERALIAYGNGVMTRYAHDARNFRLTRLRSERYAKPDDRTYMPAGSALQDLGYDYDTAGNVVGIRDRAPGSGIPNNAGAFTAIADPILGQLLSGGDALDRRFEYDPIYRLLSATGRECDHVPEPTPWTDQPRCTDVTRSRGYTERYVYDAIGNMLRLEHRNEPGGFARDYARGAASNRLLSMQVEGNRVEYAHDPCGNMRSEAASRQFEFNHVDQLKVYRTQTEGAEPSVHAHYLYDAMGQRVKKLVRKQGGQVETTHYIGAGWEHQRWGTGAGADQNNHLHVRDDARRIALVRVGSAHPDDKGPATRFDLADHLGSSTVVVDAGGAVTSREEYTPYGETAFGGYARKRYRFTGMERDEESGLGYHGLRYYSPWIGSWISPDPLGAAAGINPYQYCASSPMAHVDTTGAQPAPAASNTANIGQVAPMNSQPRAVRDSAGTRLTENEHAVPGAQLKDATRNPSTGRSDYTDAHYRNDSTYINERDAAINKTHNGPTSDNARTQDLRGRMTQGDAINYREDIFEPARANAYRAADAAGSRVSRAQINEALLGQDGNLFALHSASESGAIAASLSGGDLPGVAPDQLEFDLIAEGATPTSPGTGGSSAGAPGLIESAAKGIAENAGSAVIRGLAGLDVALTAHSIMSAKTFTAQATEVAAAGGRWGGMAYGAAVCAEFGPLAACGCAAFGAFFGEAAVRGVVRGVSATGQLAFEGMSCVAHTAKTSPGSFLAPGVGSMSMGPGLGGLVRYAHLRGQ